MPYAKNKGTDHLAHPRSLISAFVDRRLDSIIPLVSVSEISNLYLASVAAHAGLRIRWLQSPKTVFFVTRHDHLYVLMDDFAKFQPHQITAAIFGIIIVFHVVFGPRLYILRLATSLIIKLFFTMHFL